MKILSETIRYGFFALPASISLLVLQVYMPSRIAELGILSFSAIGVLFFIARLIDTVSDPLIGYLSDRIALPFCRRKAWLFFFTPFFVVVFSMLRDPPETFMSLLVILSSCYIFGTCLLVPYYAWGTEIKDGYTAFNDLSASRATFGLIGTTTALAAPTILNLGNSTQTMIEVSFSLAVGGFLLSLIFFSSIEDKVQKNTGVKNSLYDIFSVFKRGSAFNILIFSQLLNGIANALPATLFLLFSTHVLQDRALVGPLLILYFLSAIVAIPLWNKAIRHYTKEHCWRIAMITAAIIFMGTLFVTPDRVWLFALITFITGMMAGADLSLPASMLSDLVNAERKQTNKQRASIYFAVWGTTSKITLALAVGIAFPLLDIGTSFNINAKEAINKEWLIGMYALIPACLKLLSVWSLRKYRVPQNTSIKAQ